MTMVPQTALSRDRQQLIVDQIRFGQERKYPGRGDMATWWAMCASTGWRKRWAVSGIRVTKPEEDSARA